MNGNRSSEDSAESARNALHDIGNALTVVLGWLERARDLAPEAGPMLEIALEKAREAQVLARTAIRQTLPVGELPTSTASSDPGAQLRIHGTWDARNGEFADSPKVAGENDEFARGELREFGALVADIAGALSVEAERRSIRIEIEDATGGAYVPLSRVLSHALTNVLLNAMAFSPHGGTIHLELSATGNRGAVKVQDEGPGVAPSLATRIFEGHSERPGGSGIGLGHSRSALRALGGDLRLEPTQRGARFSIEVPITAGPKKTPSTQRFAAMLPGVRVLLLEDDRAVCMLLDAGLGARGIEVLALHNGAELATQLETSGPLDAVLLDLSPIANQVAEAIAAVHRHQPKAGIVFISGSAIAIDPEVFMDPARTRWVRKPFEVSEVTRAISEVILR